MIIKYPINTTPTVEIKVENDTVKMGFASEIKQLFVQVVTSYSKSGVNLGQGCLTLNKEELREYIGVLKDMHKQM